MPTFDALAALPGGAPGPWGEAVAITYDTRDVLLYAVGIGMTDLRFTFEGAPGFAVFPTFPIRWGSTGVPVDRRQIPSSPGPLTIDAERTIEQVAPLPLKGTVQVRSRLVAVHPRGKGNAFVEVESEVVNADGDVCVRMVSGSMRRGVEKLGDIEPFEGSGTTRTVKLSMPERAPDVVTEVTIADNQPHVYRLSGDYNPLHIDPAAARFGGFDRPILHGLCTYGIAARLVLQGFLDYASERLAALDVRFASIVYPGETLAFDFWREGDLVSFRARVPARDKVVLDNGRAVLR